MKDRLLGTKAILIGQKTNTTCGTVVLTKPTSITLESRTYDFPCPTVDADDLTEAVLVYDDQPEATHDDGKVGWGCYNSMIVLCQAVA